MRKILIIACAVTLSFAGKTIGFPSSGGVGTITPDEKASIATIKNKADKTALAEVNNTLQKKISNPSGVTEGFVPKVDATGNAIVWAKPSADVDLTDINNTIIKSMVINGNTVSLIKNNDSNFTVTLPSSVKLLDIQKDKLNADYDKYGTVSYKLLDNTYERAIDAKLHNIRIVMSNSERTGGAFTYLNDTLNVSDRIYYTLPNGATWSVDPIVNLNVPTGSVVYFETTLSEQLNQQTKTIPQSKLKVLNVDNFIPNALVMPVGVSQGARFRLVSGQTSDLDLGTYVTKVDANSTFRKKIYSYTKVEVDANLSKKISLSDKVTTIREEVDATDDKFPTEKAIARAIALFKVGGVFKSPASDTFANLAEGVKGDITVLLKDDNSTGQDYKKGWYIQEGDDKTTYKFLNGFLSPQIITTSSLDEEGRLHITHEDGVENIFAECALHDDWRNPNHVDYNKTCNISYKQLDKHLRDNSFYDYIVVATSFTGGTFPEDVPKNDKVLSLDSNDVYRSNGDGSFSMVNKSLFSDGSKLLIEDTDTSYRFDKPNGTFVEISSDTTLVTQSLVFGFNKDLDVLTESDVYFPPNHAAIFKTTADINFTATKMHVFDNSKTIQLDQTIYPIPANSIGTITKGGNGVITVVFTTVGTEGLIDATVTFSGATVDGLTTKVIKEKTMEYSSFLDLPNGKMIDTVEGAEIIDATLGLIAYHTDGGDITITVTLKDKPNPHEAFVRIEKGTHERAEVEFTATRDMYVLVTWNGTGRKSEAGWGWLDTKYSGATLLRGHKGKCLLFLAKNIHQTLLPDTGYFFVKSGDTARFWMEKASNINLDDNDRSSVIVREIAR